MDVKGTGEGGRRMVRLVWEELKVRQRQTQRGGLSQMRFHLS